MNLLLDRAATALCSALISVALNQGVALYVRDTAASATAVSAVPAPPAQANAGREGPARFTIGPAVPQLRHASVCARSRMPGEHWAGRWPGQSDGCPGSAKALAIQA